MRCVKAFETHFVHVASNDWMMVNNELGRIEKEVIVMMVEATVPEGAWRD